MLNNTKVVKYFEYDMYRYMYLPSMILITVGDNWAYWELAELLLCRNHHPIISLACGGATSACPLDFLSRSTATHSAFLWYLFPASYV